VLNAIETCEETIVSKIVMPTRTPKVVEEANVKPGHENHDYPSVTYGITNNRLPGDRCPIWKVDLLSCDRFLRSGKPKAVRKITALDNFKKKRLEEMRASLLEKFQLSDIGICTDYMVNQLGETGDCVQSGLTCSSTCDFYLSILDRSTRSSSD
jgi:hypothetical protein